MSTEPAAPAATARSLLFTLLGEYVHPSSERVWTGALLEAFGAVGVAEKAARQAIARAAAAGWIEGGKAGREAWWKLTPAGKAAITEGSQRVSAVRRADTAWSGSWLVLHITLPDARRTDRLRLYRVLHWLGFGSPTAGLWVCPHVDRAPALQARIEALRLEGNALAFVGHDLPVGLDARALAKQAWDLRALAAHHQALDRKFAALRPRDDRATFIAHVALVNAFQRLPAVDPGLPAALLPRDWNGARIIRRLEALRARWREPAHRYWSAL